jgi:hypothetical protein
MYVGYFWWRTILKTIDIQVIYTCGQYTTIEMIDALKDDMISKMISIGFKNGM